MLNISRGWGDLVTALIGRTVSTFGDGVASGWEGTGRITACEPLRRLMLLTTQPGEPDEPDEHSLEVLLTADGGQTILVWEERGMPLDEVAAYAGGIQIHVEDLAAYLAGRGVAMPPRAGKG